MLTHTPVDRPLTVERSNIIFYPPTTHSSSSSRLSEIQEQTSLWTWDFHRVFQNTWKGQEPEPSRICRTLWRLSALCYLYDFTSDCQLVWPRDTGTSSRTCQMAGRRRVASGPVPSAHVILGHEVQVLRAHGRGPTGQWCLRQVLENSKTFWDLTDHALSRKGTKALQCCTCP